MKNEKSKNIKKKKKTAQSLKKEQEVKNFNFLPLFTYSSSL